MRILINIIIFIADLLIALCIICLAIYCEYKLIRTNLDPLIGDEYSEWSTLLLIGIAGLTFYELAKLNGKVLDFIFIKYRPDEKTNKSKTNSCVSSIITKPLGGYSREQLNYIYLFGILIHQIYYSATGISLSEKQQRKALNIQMRFFITVFPQRNVNEYFDFTEAFMDKNEGLSHYSVLEATERSMQVFSTCNNKQIRKLRTLYNTLYILYIEVGGGNKTALNTYVEMLDSELSNLTVEDDWRNHYPKKKTL